MKEYMAISEPKPVFICAGCGRWFFNNPAIDWSPSYRVIDGAKFCKKCAQGIFYQKGDPNGDYYTDENLINAGWVKDKTYTAVSRKDVDDVIHTYQKEIVVQINDRMGKYTIWERKNENS